MACTIYFNRQHCNLSFERELVVLNVCWCAACMYATNVHNACIRMTGLCGCFGKAHGCKMVAARGEACAYNI